MVKSILHHHPVNCSATLEIHRRSTDRQDSGDGEAADLHRTIRSHSQEALHGAVEASELGEPVDHGVPDHDVPEGQFVEQAVRVVGEAEPEAGAEQGAGAEEVVCEAAAECERVDREEVMRGRGGGDERREGEWVRGVDEAEAAEDGESERVREGERGVEAGQRRGGGEEERDDGVEGGDARVEGDEGREGGGGRGEVAGDEEVGVERQEQAPGGRMRVRDDGAEREVQGRHFSGRQPAAVPWPGHRTLASRRREFQSTEASGVRAILQVTNESFFFLPPELSDVIIRKYSKVIFTVF